MILSSPLKFEEAPTEPRQKTNEIPLRFFTVKPVILRRFPQSPGLQTVPSFTLRDEERWWRPL